MKKKRATKQQKSSGWKMRFPTLPDGFWEMATITVLVKSSPHATVLENE